MPPAPLHPYEADRLASLASYPTAVGELDPSMQALVDSAAMLAGTPVALIGLLDEDKQFFLARRGVEAASIPRSWAMCGYVVAAGEPIAIRDTRADARCADNPLASREPQLRAYLGLPIVGRDGLPLGTLCVMDHVPRRFAAELVRHLTALAGAAADLLEQRRSDGRSDIDTSQAVRTGRGLRRALANNELVLHYQPVVELDTDQTVSYEALLRWQNPHHGLLAPGAFLPVIEGGSLAGAVGRWVLNRAVSQAAARNWTVAVNVAAAQWSDAGFVDDVLSVLAVHGLAPAQLMLEVSEHQVLDGPAARNSIGRLRDAGVVIALDDFGAAFSGLARRNHLDVDVLKLDISLTRQLTQTARCRHIVAAVLDLAARLQLRVVAEGVESAAQRDLLRELGCHMAQGWLLGHPLPSWQIFDAEGVGLGRRSGDAADLVGLPSAARVRSWGRRAGLPVPARGRLPARLLQEYLAAH